MKQLQNSLEFYEDKKKKLIDQIKQNPATSIGLKKSSPSNLFRKRKENHKTKINVKNFNKVN